MTQILQDASEPEGRLQPWTCAVDDKGSLPYPGWQIVISTVLVWK